MYCLDSCQYNNAVPVYSASSRYCVSIRFVLGRVTMRSMHYAVDQLDLSVIFPDVQTTPNSSIPSSSDVQKCLDVVKDSVLNHFQVQAIASMLDPSCLKVRQLTLSCCTSVGIVHVDPFSGVGAIWLWQDPYTLRVH